ncbi:MAG: hypothetical protein KJZ80_11865 [Hyphomicrobiaceae bacterium]|nr:hypothetical protein [Hyphomicrobiaceae bacterium]
MSSGRMIDYESLAQDAMRGVVRSVLTRIAKSGLPGDHHFYISFDTQAPGVGLSKRLKDKYPEEMTIVLQHRFWDLTVGEDRFEVKLTFDGIPERLVVPFAALKVFFDPSVRYGLQFEAPDFGPDAIAHPQASRGETSAGGPHQVSFRSPPRAAAERKPARSPRKPRADRGEQAGATEAGSLRAAPAKPVLPAESKPEEPEARPAVALAPAAPGAEIVRLDAFRKK